MKKSTIAGIALLGASILGCVATANGNPIDTEKHYTYIAPTPVENTDPYQMRSIRCADYDNKVEPCWTLEKGKYSLILSWYPKKAIPLKECEAEDGSYGNLPCIWKDTNTPKKKSDPITRNIFWKGNLK